MNQLALFLVPSVMAAGVAVAALNRGRVGTPALPQPAKQVHVANPYAEVDREPPPQLFVDPPDPAALAQGVVWIQYRVENLRIVPVFGEGALSVSPRIGHLHIHVDNLPWLWADPSNTGTVDIAEMPPGEHTVRIELVDTNHQVFPGQSRTVRFTVPGAPAAAAAIEEGTLPPGYRDWRLISVAREEGDLDDIRAVLGNDTAIGAYRDGREPYPDGTIIARLAWALDPSEENNTAFGRRQSFVAGHPKNGVQFMVKNATKYASTGGWLYAHFDDGKPLTDAAQIQSCFDCHRAVKARDYVFTRYAP